MRVRAGQKIDRYELLEPLGAGGQGSVWRAKDLLENGVIRAVKLIVREKVSADDFERARREAHTLAKTQHPALIGCHGVFDDVRVGIGGIVLDFIDGVPVSDVLHDSKMTAVHRLALLQQLMDALAFVHERNIVHRDLKPDNILLTHEFWASPTKPGTVKLIDFGISVEVGNPRPLTATGAVFGTAPYLAPELLAGDLAVGNHGAQSADGFPRDMFAFGVLAAELLLGRHPTDLPLHASREQFARVYRDAARKQRVWPPADLTGPLSNAVRACLSISVRGRPRSGTELIKLAQGEKVIVPQTDLAMSASPIKERTTEQMTHAPTYRSMPDTPQVRAPMPVIPPPPADRIPTEPSLRIPTRSNGGMVVTFVAGLAIAGGGFYAATQWSTGEIKENAPMFFPQSTGASKLQEDPPAVTPRVDSFPAVKATATATSMANMTGTSLLPPSEPELCPAPCCGGADCRVTDDNNVKPELCLGSKTNCEKCGSKRTCIPGACGDELDPNGIWLLRLAKVIDPQNQPLQSTFPNAEVCLRLTKAPPGAPWACTSMRMAGEPNAAETGLKATRKDLFVDGIDIFIRPLAGVGRLAEKHHAVTLGRLNSALCIGLNLRGAKDSWGGDYTVTVYLDDVTP